MAYTKVQLDAATAAVSTALENIIKANVPGFFQAEAEAALKTTAPQIAQDALDAADAAAAPSTVSPPTVEQTQ